MCVCACVRVSKGPRAARRVVSAPHLTCTETCLRVQVHLHGAGRQRRPCTEFEFPLLSKPAYLNPASPQHGGEVSVSVVGTPEQV